MHVNNASASNHQKHEKAGNAMFNGTDSYTVLVLHTGNSQKQMQKADMECFNVSFANL